MTTSRQSLQERDGPAMAENRPAKFVVSAREPSATRHRSLPRGAGPDASESAA
jgi:hypothetical protein